MTQKSCLTCRFWRKNAPRPDVNWGQCERIYTTLPTDLIIIEPITEAKMFTRDVFYCAMFEQFDATKTVVKTTGS